MINAPYMVDEKGEASSQLKLEILSQNGVNLNISLLLIMIMFIHQIGVIQLQLIRNSQINFQVNYI